MPQILHQPSSCYPSVFESHNLQYVAPSNNNSHWGLLQSQKLNAKYYKIDVGLSKNLIKTKLKESKEDIKILKDKHQKSF